MTRVLKLPQTFKNKAPGWVMRTEAGGRPATVDFDFINNRRWDRFRTVSALDGMTTVTRALPATTYYVNEDWTLTSFAANIPRIGSRGLLVEESRTNVVLHCRDLTNAAWVKTNITAAKNQTGPDGVGNSASLISATAANGTCLQSITLASSARWQSVFIKRVTGTGVVQVTMDNGATWTAVTVTSSWARVEIPTQTLANPTVGFRIVTSGDEVAVDFVQNENSGVRATSPIETTTASVTRSADVILQTGGEFCRATNGRAYTIYAQGIDGVGNAVTSPALFQLDNTSGSQLLFARMGNNAWAPLFRDVSGATLSATTTTTGLLIEGPKRQRVIIGASENSFRILSNEGTVTKDSTSTPTPSFNRLAVGSQNTSNAWMGYLERLAIWDDEMTDEELQLLAVANVDQLVLLDGDSIGVSPTGASNMTTLLRHVYAGKGWFVPTLCVSGSYLTAPTASINPLSTTRLATLQLWYDRVRRANPNVKTVVILSTGHNDIATGGHSAATVQTNILSYFAELDVRGFRGTSRNKTAMLTILPSTTANVNTRRAAINPAILGYAGVEISYDMDNSAITGCADGDASNVAFYVDGIHPSAAHAVTLTEAIVAQVTDLAFA